MFVNPRVSGYQGLRAGVVPRLLDYLFCPGEAGVIQPGVGELRNPSPVAVTPRPPHL